jgi:hypothetical protein
MKSIPVIALAFLLLAVGVSAPDSFSVQSQVKLDAAQQALVDSSKKAIIATGFSESYFNSHFTLLKVFNQPADRRVMWKFAINGYESVINDSIGSTSVGSKQINIHSVSRSLGRTTEISKTISRPRALRALKSCIGNYTEPYIDFGQVKGQAELFLVGTQKPKVNRREQVEALEREREEVEERSRTIGATDVIENEEGDKQKLPVIIGYINLQTGKCTRGKGVLAKEGL